MICLGCKEFYVGETGDTLRNRFTVHRQQMALEPENAPVPVDPHLRTCSGGGRGAGRMTNCVMQLVPDPPGMEVIK